MTATSVVYHPGFYERQSGPSHLAARSILPHVFASVRPRSVVDVGCGVGTWLAAAHQCGAERLVGLEGDWVDEGDLRAQDIELIRADLEEPVRLGEEFDLAMSLEVAEHLTPERGESFVGDLCRLSKAVLFGAAIPGQGGVNHLNERWQSYWVELFERHDYRPIDLVRPLHWNDRSIPVHYRQNTLLYVHSTHYESVARSIDDCASPWPYDLVHPEMYLDRVRERDKRPTLREALDVLAGLPRIAWNSIAVRLRFSPDRDQASDA